jgi:uncharacterized HAD superfamily protein
MKIAIDVDGTICQTFERWQELCGKEGLHFEPSELKVHESGKLHSIGGIPYDDILDIIKTDDELALSYEPYSGVALILALLQDHALFIVTARGDFEPGLVQSTYHWLERHRIPHKEAHFTPRKLERCKELGVDLVIEDDATWAVSLAEAGTKVLLFDKPYNQEVSHPNIVRFTHWGEVPRLLRSREALAPAPQAVPHQQ